MIVCLFKHTKQGEATLAAWMDAGVAHSAVQVIGDLGAPAGQPTAFSHGTFDTLHVPVGLRALFMDTVRGGGVVLAVDEAIVAVEEVEMLAARHEALRVLRTSATVANPSHNAAG